MLKQSYRSKDFLSVIQKSDVPRWSLWENKREKEEKIIELEEDLKENEYCIDNLQKSSHKGKIVYLPSNPKDYFALKLLDRYLRRIYKVVQSDRSKIVRQIKCLLEDQGNFMIIKCDIKSFYESINFNYLIDKIKNDMILTPKGIYLLESLKNNYYGISNSNNGIPRGIGVSATLSELYMRTLDEQISSYTDVIYYARYVDDIFIFADKEKVDLVKDCFENRIDDLGLSLNENKQLTIDLSTNVDFSYLGYRFEITRNNKGGRIVKLRIAKKKVKKIKQRIYKSFLDFEKTADFQLLIKRLRYLSCNKIIKKTKNGNLMAGNSYNYCNVTDETCLKVFDGFINKIMPSFSLNPQQQSKIRRISFYRAYIDKKKASFTKRQSIKIKNIWTYEK